MGHSEVKLFIYSLLVLFQRNVEEHFKSFCVREYSWDTK